ncbi:MAG: Nitrogen regulation protein NR(II) [Alphaproteobacteria bacterium UBA4588]|nr:MAG: Nitrogen regulation protein NR(II) [Alphaproteobacteria bacterium UBA4588]
MVSSYEQSISEQNRGEQPEGGLPAAKQMMDILPFPVFMLDENDRFLWLNHAAEGFFHSSQAMLVPMQMSELLISDSPFFSLVRRARQSERPVSDKSLRLISPKFGVRNAAIQVTPLPVSENVDERGVVLVTLQEQGLSDKLAAQNTVKSAALSMSKMTSLLAHEVKNPLAGIKGAAQLLETEIPEESRELSSMIVTEADRITALLNRIENLSSDMPVQLKDVNIHEILDHCIRITTASFGRHLEIKCHYDPSLPNIDADPDLLVQCFLNLFKNASEVTDDKGILTLTTSYNLSRYLSTSQSFQVHLPLQIEIEDNGSGIPEELQDYIFEPFISGKQSGSGLGLAMVASVVADHGGAISVDTSPAGSCFTVNLPIPSHVTSRRALHPAGAS